jgi:hypothetical protein
MATIVIKDLPENTELDRKAMLAVIGGSRFRAGGSTTRSAPQRVRLFDLAKRSAGKAGASTTRTPSR